MATVYVEARPKGRIDGSPITDYVVEDHANHVLGTFKTQHDAAERAKSQGHTPHGGPRRRPFGRDRAPHSPSCILSAV
jgi:hypothetical protein